MNTKRGFFIASAIFMTGLSSSTVEKLFTLVEGSGMFCHAWIQLNGKLGKFHGKKGISWIAVTMTKRAREFMFIVIRLRALDVRKFVSIFISCTARRFDGFLLFFFPVEMILKCLDLDFRSFHAVAVCGKSANRGRILLPAR